MSNRRVALLGATLVLGLFAGAGFALAGSGSNDIVFTYLPGLPFATGRFTDPTGFSCADGNFPQHDPPRAFERRCTPTFASTQCTGLEAKGSVVGGLFAASSIEVNSSCSNGVDAPALAWCTATAPPYPATCADGPSAAVVGPGYTFHCHVKPGGAAFFIGATCTAVAN